MRKIKLIFVITMTILIALFLIRLCFDSSGIQTQVVWAHFDKYMSDFTDNIGYVLNGNPYLKLPDEVTSADHAYPPLAYLIFKIFAKITLNFKADTAGIFVCHSGMMIFAFALFAVLYNGMKSDRFFNNFLIFAFLFSGIFWFAFERGNIILLSAALIAFFIFNYKSENKIIREFAFLSLAAASALKITPFILVLLLIYDKNYKGALRAFLYAAFLFFIPFFVFDGNLGLLPQFIANLKIHSAYYSYRGAPEFDNLFGYFDIQHFLRAAYVKIGFIVSIVAIFTNFFQKIEWKRNAQLVLFMHNLTSVLSIYAMVNFFVFIVLFFNKKEVMKDDIVYLILMILILNPFQVGSGLSFDFVKISQLTLFSILTFESLYLAFQSFKGKFLNA